MDVVVAGVEVVEDVVVVGVEVVGVEVVGVVLDDVVLDDVVLVGTVVVVEPVVDVGARDVVVTKLVDVADTRPAAVTVGRGASVVVDESQSDVTTAISLISSATVVASSPSSSVTVASCIATSGAAFEIDDGCWVVDDNPGAGTSDLEVSINTSGVRTTTWAARIAASTFLLLMPPPRERPSRTQRPTPPTIADWRSQMSDGPRATRICQPTITVVTPTSGLPGSRRITSVEEGNTLGAAMAGRQLALEPLFRSVRQFTKFLAFPFGVEHMFW